MGDKGASRLFANQQAGRRGAVGTRKPLALTMPKASSRHRGSFSSSMAAIVTSTRSTAAGTIPCAAAASASAMEPVVELPSEAAADALAAAGPNLCGSRAGGGGISSR